MQFPQRAFRVPAFAIISATVFVVSALAPRAMVASSRVSVSPAALQCGAVVVGKSKTFLVTVSNDGSESVTISSISVSNAAYKLSTISLPKVLAGGGSMAVTVTFSPKATGGASGKVTFTSNASNKSLNLGLSGSGRSEAAINASPASLSFGQVEVGSSSTLPVTLTNAQTSALVLTSLTTTSTEFSVSGATFPLTLNPGKSIKLNAKFTPHDSGTSGGNVFVAGPSLSIPLSGAGTETSKPKLTIAPSTLSFGNVTVGTTETLTLGLNATGGSVTVSSATSSDAQFALSGVTFPLTIAAGKEVSVNVKFKPSKKATTSASLSFKNNTSVATVTESMSGTGTLASVNLSWVASTSSGVTGYNVYRGTSSTGAMTKVKSMNPDTDYTDPTVASGTTYYYATTAVNSSGQESVYSNKVKAVVP